MIPMTGWQTERVNWFERGVAMRPPLLPINLTTRAEGLREASTSGMMPLVLMQPGFHCDQFDAAGLHKGGAGQATRDEVFCHRCRPRQHALRRRYNHGGNRGRC